MWRLGFALLLSLMSLGGRLARADELPVDTNAIESLTPEEARSVVADAGSDNLELNALERLDSATAAALAEFRGTGLSLNGLFTLDAATARALATFKGTRLHLSGLTTLDTETAKALARFRGQWLWYLEGVTAIDAATARVLAEIKGTRLHLSGLRAINAATAEALAAFKGRSLALNGLTVIDAATAEALAKFEGNDLSLSGLASLDADTVAALAEYRGHLSLAGEVLKEFIQKNPLTPSTALAYAAWRGGDLSGLTVFESPDSVEVARVLAARNGPLSLPDLERISPKTLGALIEKRDVVLPRLETLELIQEPDGSPTEDFVIPEWFKQRY